MNQNEVLYTHEQYSEIVIVR